MTEPLSLRVIAPEPPEDLLGWEGVIRAGKRRQAWRAAASVTACIVVIAAVVVGAVSVGGGSSPPPKPAAATRTNGPLVFVQAGTTHKGTNLLQPHLEVVSAHGTSEHRLTRRASLVAGPAVTPDGAEVAYVDARGLNTPESIHFVSIDGSDDHVVTGCSALCQDLAWSPNGQQLAFADQGVIETISRDGMLRVVDSRHDAAQPVWSPDGRQIAFSQLPVLGQADNPSISAIYVVNSDGTDLRKITDRSCAQSHGSAKGCTADTGPAWSPDGKQIAFSRSTIPPLPPAPYEGANPPGVFVMGADGQSVRRLWACPQVSCATETPQWSPDGTALAFVTGAGVQVVRSNGATVATLNPSRPHGDDEDQDAVTWAPDGTAIAMELAAGHQAYRLYTASATGADLRRLPLRQVAGYTAALAWAASTVTDSSGRLLFTVGTAAVPLDPARLVSASPDGPHVANVTTRGTDEYAAVSPDGS